MLFYKGIYYIYTFLCNTYICLLYHCSLLFSVGISSETILKPSSISEEELFDLIEKLNSDHRVDGLLVQLPLPGRLTEEL